MNADETCRYTMKPMSKCKCRKGCDPVQIEPNEWVQPVRKGYRLTCCNCGLVHEMDFRVYRGKIQFRARIPKHWPLKHRIQTLEGKHGEKR